MLLIYVPTASEEEAKKIGKTLVEEKLACCANVIPGVTSYYRWHGKLEEEREALLLIKTTSDYHEVRKRIEKLHSYEIPLISAMHMDHLNEEYAEWAEKELGGVDHSV